MSEAQPDSTTVGEPVAVPGDAPAADEAHADVAGAARSESPLVGGGTAPGGAADSSEQKAAKPPEAPSEVKKPGPRAIESDAVSAEPFGADAAAAADGQGDVSDAALGHPPDASGASTSVAAGSAPAAPSPSAGVSAGASTSAAAAASLAVTDVPRAHEASFTQIQVTPDEHSGSGPNYYVVTAVCRASGGSSHCRRRFADLVALHETLKRAYRGCIIPFRPGKTLSNSTALHAHGESFLRERAFAIKCYLAKIVRHPEIQDTEILRQFMESEEVLQGSEVWAREQPARVSAVVGLVHSVRKLAGTESRIPTPSQVALGTGKSEHDLVRQMVERKVDRKALHAGADEGERALLDAGDMLPDWIKANQGLAAGAGGLVEAARSVLEAIADNGQGLATLATFEGTWQGSAELHISEAARTALGACVDAMGRCCGDTARVTLMRQMALLAPISDHAFMLPRVQKALAARIDALVVLESLRRQEAVIGAAFNELRAKELSGPMSNADVRKMNRARAEVDQVEQARNAGTEAYATARHRNERDLATYRRDRCRRMTEVVLRYADAQASASAVVGDVWLAMAHKLGADTTDAGPDLAALSLADLGPCVSHSALLPEAAPNEPPGGDVVANGPLPAEHAELV